MRNKYLEAKKMLSCIVATICLLCVSISGLTAQQSTCSCSEKVYLNDVQNSLVHKFDVGDDGTFTEVGSPWLASDVINEPHGLGTDINGSVIIGAGDGFANNSVQGDIFKLNCDGTVDEADFIPAEVNENYGFNFGTAGGVLYYVDNNLQRIEARSTCDGELIGYMRIGPDEFTGFSAWGFYTDENQWYVTERSTGGVYTGSLDPDQYDAAGTNSGFEAFNTGVATTNFLELAAMGITRDPTGNYYIVFNNFLGNFASTEVRKYSPTGMLLEQIVDDTEAFNAADGQSGFWGGRGLVYSVDSDRLYLGNRDNCVTVFDSELVEQTAFNVGNPTNGQPKGIAVTVECCPDLPSVTIDTTICVANEAALEEVFLQELISCNGPICEGDWTETMGDANITFEECNNRLTFSGPGGCAQYTLSSDGDGAKVCGAFDITVNICFSTRPLVTFTPMCEFDDGDGTSNFSADAVVTSSPGLAGRPVSLILNDAEVATGVLDAAGAFTFPTSNLMQGESFSNTYLVEVGEAGVCSSSGTFDLIACTPDCDDNDGSALGGSVFNDLNSDGDNAGALEVGQSNVLVTVYDCDGTVACEVYTNADGNWSCDGLAEGERYRVEFSKPLQEFLQPTFNGPASDSDVQFLTAGTCDASYGVLDPDAICLDPDPLTLSTCYVSGDPLAGGSAGGQPVIIAFDYSSSGNGAPNSKGGNTAATDPPIAVASAAEFGSVYGIAYDREMEVAYTAAFVKRHVGIGPLGEGGIYKIDYSDEDNPVVMPWLDVNDVGIPTGTVGTGATPAARNQSRGLMPDEGDLGTTGDQLAFDAVAKIGLADIDISPDGRTLWVINPNNKTLNELLTDADDDPNTVPVAADVTSFPTPDPCGDGTSWPFATKVYRGDVYVGVVCENALEGYIYRFDGANFNPVSIDGSPVLDLSYTKGEATNDNSPCREKTGWFTWRSTPAPRCGFNDLYVHPTPIISDIEFDESGAMILGLMDRSSHQFGNLSADFFEPITFENYHAGGDILRVCNVNGDFVLQGGTGCANNAANNGVDIGGPNGGEFYFQDYFSFNSDGSNVLHGETALGGLSILPGSGEIIATSYDPFGTSFLSGGINWFSNTTGEARDPGYQVYFGQDAGGFDGGTGNFGKAAGLGDVEIVCPIPPIQVGNYAWIDTNNDGIQQACEEPLPGLPVTLFDDEGNRIATTITDANGNYDFSSISADDPNLTWVGMGADTAIMPFSDYTIVFGTDGDGGDTFDPATGTLINMGVPYATTTSDSGEGRLPEKNDSDVSPGVLAGYEGFPSLAFSSGAFNNQSFDAGFAPICPEVALLPESPSLCGDASLTLAAIVDSVSREDIFDYEWATSGDGTFVDAGGAVTIDYELAVDYIPGDSDRRSGGVVITLQAAEPVPTDCPPAEDTLEINILNVDCGEFFWGGE